MFIKVKRKILAKFRTEKKQWSEILLSPRILSYYQIDYIILYYLLDIIVIPEIVCRLPRRVFVVVPLPRYYILLHLHMSGRNIAWLQVL